MQTWRLLSVLAAASAIVQAAGWERLFDGRSLSGWQSIGEGTWTILEGGVLVGAHNATPPVFPSGGLTKQAFEGWRHTQAWLYTAREFGDFDLELEYWLRHGGNSGVSLRDPSRASYAIGADHDFSRTPSKLGYEIQLNNLYPDPHPSGSIYTFAKAATGAQRDDQWNQLAIESRADLIRVKINGRLVAEHPGDPKRPKRGPVGLQLHDRFSVVMFRNIRIRER